MEPKLASLAPSEPLDPPLAGRAERNDWSQMLRMADENSDSGRVAVQLIDSIGLGQKFVTESPICRPVWGN
jgi:hypothetical protein